VHQSITPGAIRGSADQAKEIIDAAVEDVARTKRVRAEIEAAASKPKTQRVALGALIVALPVLGILYITNIQGWSLADLVTPAPPPAVARQQAEEALQFVVHKIELFRKDYSDLPDSLAEVGTPLKGEWRYEKTTGNHYQIALRFKGQTVMFDSLVPLLK
jgi:hypothetical protein